MTLAMESLVRAGTQTPPVMCVSTINYLNRSQLKKARFGSEMKQLKEKKHGLFVCQT